MAPPAAGTGMSGPSPGWETVIGLEVHAQLATRSKMFCGCPTAFGAPPNTQTCPVCLGLPGSLPVVNRGAVELALRAALALECRVNAGCRFARKHYFYPDMPKNFQISQYEEPLAEDGGLEVDTPGGSRRIGIQRLHLEEDVGKLVHEGTLDTAAASLVDYNRSGVPLMETVTRPELASPEEAAAWLEAFRAVVVDLDVCDGNMEEGSLRCDANISLRRRGDAGLGTKVEIKNLNSFRFVRQALEHEARRQAAVLDAGGQVVQETRLWDAERGQTRPMRTKEYAHDYRYFPEPDLVPLRMDAAWIAGIRSALPELPRARRRRFVAAYGLTAYDAGILTRSRALAAYYEETVAAAGRGRGPVAGAAAISPKGVANWMTSELLRAIPADDPAALAGLRVRPAQLAGLLQLVEEGTITGKIAKTVFERMLGSGEEAAAIVAREGLTQVADPDALRTLVAEVVAANPRAVEDFRRGKRAAAKAVVGQVMKASGGKANPALVNRLVEEKLSES